MGTGVRYESDARLAPPLHSFILRKALGAKPALIGNKGLRIPYFKGENWFEVDIDVDSDSQARNITGMVIGATKSLVVDIAFLIESQLEEVCAHLLVML